MTRSPRSLSETPTVGTRKPSTPDCGCAGCSRAAYKFGICRRHHALLPWTFRLEYMGAVFATYVRMNKKAARLARQIERA